MRRGPNFDMMVKQLGLTDEQAPKFRSIMETRMQKIRELRQNPDYAKLSPEEKVAKAQAIQEETTTKMKALLTPEQFEKWQNMAGMRGRPMRPPPGRENTRGTNAPAPPPPSQPPQK